MRLVTVFIAATVTAACSSGKTASSSPTISPGPTASATVESLVLEAWRAEHLAYADALRGLNPQLPALAQTAIDPALRRAVAFIATSKAQGIAVRGSQDLGSPKVIDLTPAGVPTTAVVEACVHDGLVLVNGKTGKPVPGSAGQVTWAFEHTTLKLIEGVGWMVADNVVKQASKESVCAGS